MWVKKLKQYLLEFMNTVNLGIVLKETMRNFNSPILQIANIKFQLFPFARNSCVSETLKSLMWTSSFKVKTFRISFLEK